MDRSSVAIIIPAFNEEESIANVVGDVLPFGITIVVDDSSVDKTSKFASDAGAIVVAHNYNQGYDAALNSGFSKAAEIKCDFVITFDADGQHDPSCIPMFLSDFAKGYDFVLGAREKFPRVSELLFSAYSKVFFGINDPLCGMKGYKLEFYISQGYFDSYQSIGTQLLFYGLSNGASFSQVKIPIKERKTPSRFGSSWRAEAKILQSMFRSTRYLNFELSDNRRV